MVWKEFKWSLGSCSLLVPVLISSLVLLFFQVDTVFSYKAKSRAHGNVASDGYPIHCDDTSNCNRAQCNDRTSYAPVRCHGHVSVMECFQHCKDPEGLLNCFEQRKENKTEAHCMIKYARQILQPAESVNSSKTSYHLGLPCKIKCLVDAKFWGCVHKCDNGGCFESFRKCEREGDPPPCTNTTFNYWSNEKCTKCYVRELIEELKTSPNCVIRYGAQETGFEDDQEYMLIRADQRSLCAYSDTLPGEEDIPDENTEVAKDISGCVAVTSEQFSKKAMDVGAIEKCYRLRLMKRHFDLCYRTEFTAQCGEKGMNTKSCHDRCIDFLAKPLCHIPCPRSPELEVCKQTCDVKLPVTKCLCGGVGPEGTHQANFFLDKGMARINSYCTDTKECRIAKCYADRIHEMKFEENGEEVESWKIESVKLRNCMSTRHVREFAKKMITLYNNSRMEMEMGYDEVKVRFADDIGKLASHYTDAECREKDCMHVSENDKLHCVKNCINKERSSVEMDVVCNENNPEAYFLRSEVVLWCLIEVSVVSGDPIKWSFKDYVNAASKSPPETYKKLVKCEMESRDKNGSAIEGYIYWLMANATYHLEKEWCAECISSATTGRYHSYNLEHAACILKECYDKAVLTACPKLKSTATYIHTSTHNICGWQIDYSLTRQPYKIWKHYFDELAPHDGTANLQRPNAEKYLLNSTVASSKGNFVFPYFVVLRGICEDGYYDDNVFKFITSGVTPAVRLYYRASSSRSVHINLIRASLQGALINLERTTPAEKQYIPENPLNRINETTGEYDGKLGCHLNLCYPAFVVPQVLLNIPSFQINVQNQQSFSSLTIRGYVSTFHARDIQGVGSIRVGDRKHPPTAAEYFPNRKVKVYEDTQYADLWNRLPDSGYVSNTNTSAGGKGYPPGPELHHLADGNCKPYKQKEAFVVVGGIEHLPLDTEDFTRIDYVFGNSPQVVIAGFYNPNLVIIGDPDMKNFQLVRWNFDSGKDSNTRLFHDRHACLTESYKVGGHPKPMYSLFDISDADYWLQYYRMRYAPLDYANVTKAMAIFAAVTLEDRVLLVTTGGIVSLYQNYNQTASMGKAWQVEEHDAVERCFKIVRASKQAHPLGETIVAITYDYQLFDKHQNIMKDINQEVWVGKYIKPGEPIKWQELTFRSTSDKLKEERVFNVGGEKLGSSEKLPDNKIMEIPVERREANPKSQIEGICYKAYRSKMAKASYIELIEDIGWCDAIDATPVTSTNSLILLLIRMRVYYSGANNVAKIYSSENELKKERQYKRVVIFYLIASIDVSYHSNWEINSIIPRIPCLDEHREAIPSVVSFKMEYFKQGDSNKLGGDLGCHMRAVHDKNDQRGVVYFLHGIAQTKSYNRHMFLYGNRLLQSTDGGVTFVNLKSFPPLGPDYHCKENEGVYHRIKMMTFDAMGHYAFLTSKRELWYGNLGSLVQIKLRPSAAYSMTSVRIPVVREMAQAVPFSIFFDSSDTLVEMVAVVDTNGKVIRIARRPVYEKTIIRANFLLKKMNEAANKFSTQLEEDSKKSDVISNKLLDEFRFVPGQFSAFCPYVSHSFRHNFSVKYARSLHFVLPNPRQHSSLGTDYTITSLYAFQAASFWLIWKSYFNMPYRSYSYVNMNTFELWIKERNEAAIIGRLNFLSSDPEEHGILILPEKYLRRYSASIDDRRIFDNYYLDYGVTIRLTIQYSVSNDFSLNMADYAHHTLNQINLNVDNANGSLIQVNTERQVLASQASVRYVIHMSVKKNTGLQQYHSGRSAIKVPIYFHLIGAFGNCVQTLTTGILGDAIFTTIVVGCPPAVDLVFNWKDTLNSIKFRDQSAHFGSKPEECHKEEPFCFFVKYPLVLYFHVFDEARQTYLNYTGKYVMRVVAGGYSRDDLKPYTQEEQQAYNIPGVSDVSLIWNEWDRVFHRKVERREIGAAVGGRNDSREIILTSGESSIQWSCHTLSPCARVSPTTTLESIYYFKIFVTNRGVDADTLCLFEKEFIILLYGFPPSTEIQLITTVLFYIVILALVYIAFFFLRDDKKVWRQVKDKVYGWVQIVIDTLPKKWTRSDEEKEEETEAERQRRRDEIILSLQGHLNIPRLIHKVTVHSGDAGADETRRATNESGDAQLQSSVSSIQSLGSVGSKFPILNPVSVRPPAATWTDLIYEQIISKRLAAIIERNKQKAEQLKNKSTVDAEEDNE